MWDAQPCLAKHSLIKEVSVSISLLEMLNGQASKDSTPPASPHDCILLANFHSEEQILNGAMNVARSFWQDALKSMSSP